MFFRKKTTRRNILKTGIASLFAATSSIKKSQAALRPKGKEETKVVYFGGDGLHNGLGQRQHIYSVLRETGWRFMVPLDARFLTPDFLSDTDLLIMSRCGPVEIWSPEPIIEGMLPNDGFMSDELEEAIVDNVKNRGMGFMSLHCTIWNSEHDKFMELLGIKCMMHGPVQNIHLHNFNPNHVISKGIEDFDLELDENFGVELLNENAIPLYETTGHEDKRHDIAGWCMEQGKGRVVGLVAGHTVAAWTHPLYRKLYWRGAHWAMKKEIPPYDG